MGIIVLPKMKKTTDFLLFETKFNVYLALVLLLFSFFFNKEKVEGTVIGILMLLEGWPYHKSENT